MEKVFLPIVVIFTLLILSEIVLGITFYVKNKMIKIKLDEYKNTHIDSKMVMGIAFPFILMSLESMTGILIILILFASIFAAYDYYIIREYKKLKDEFLDYTREE